MAYIGTRPTVGNFVKLDSIVTSATTTFNLLNGGVAYYPQSANHCLVSLNGILQAPTDSFTISGSTIIFSSALTTSDVIDFIIVLGDVLNIGTPSDNTVSLAKLTATGTKDSTTFLRGDNTFATAGATAGQVIQVVSNSYSTNVSTTSTSFVATGYTATITPSSTSNKILIFVNGGVTDYDSGTPQIWTMFYSNINSAGYNSISNRIESLKMPDVYTSNHSMSYYYSPSTTSSIIIQPYFKSSSGDNVYFNRDFGTVTITLMEVKG